MKLRVIALLFFAALLFSGQQAVAQVKASDIEGVWLTGSGNGLVEIKRGSDGKYYGTLIAIKDPNNEDGTPKRDVENPDKSKRNQKLVGLKLLTGFVWDADDEEWDDGDIYDPENGKTYSCIIDFDDENNKNVLDVRGYVGFSWIGRTDTWTRSNKRSF